MTQSGSSKKIANSLVSASCAAVLAVYVAGYTRTQSAADRFAAQGGRRVPALHPPRTAPPMEESRSTAPDPPVSVPSPVTPPKPTRNTADKGGLIASAKPVPAVVDPSAAAEPSPTEPPTPVEEHKIDLAPVAIPAAVLPVVPPPSPAPPAPVWKDGKYTGWGYSRHGDIQAEVVIEGGRIASATIAQCLTRYSCSVIDKLPPEVAQRQSPDVDFVSGATQSADAFYWAVVDALTKAK